MLRKCNRCERDDCFAFCRAIDNRCSCLSYVSNAGKDCHFYKMKDKKNNRNRIERDIKNYSGTKINW